MNTIDRSFMFRAKTMHRQKNSLFIRYCSQLAPISKKTSILGSPSCPTTSEIHDHLLGLCLQECGTITARNVFDEMPHRISRALNTAKVIHAQSLRHEFGLSGLLGNAILDLYAKCGNAKYTKMVFDKLENRDVQAWNSVMSMNMRCGSLGDVMKFFGSMRVLGVLPNQFSYAIVLSGCARLMAISLGEQVHSDVIKMGYLCNSFCEGSLIDMYVKCNALSNARRLFDHTNDPSLVSWTAMIMAYAQVGLPDEALKVFENMEKFGCVPDHVAYATVISAFVKEKRLDEARNLFTQMTCPNAIAWNLMISGHLKQGYEAEAVYFFLNMRKSGVSSTRSTLGSVLSAIASLRDLDLGLPVHAQAIKQGLDSNVYVGSSLMSMYAKCQKTDRARQVFDSLDEKNIVLWNTMLGGYAQNDFPNEVIELFVCMKDGGFQADEFTYTSILSACGCLERLDFGTQLHSVIIKTNFESDLFVGNALVDMYAKSGALAEARLIFERIKNRDNVSWNAIIVGYVQVEEEDEAFSLFRRMMSDGIKADEVALASILSACSNLKDLTQGKQVHCLSIKHGLETSLYAGSSLIDMYVKCGATLAASQVFYSMPKWGVVSINALIAGHVKDNLEEAVNLYKLMQARGLCPSEITYVNLLDASPRPSKLDLGRQIHCLILKKGLPHEDELLGSSLLGMYMDLLRKEDAIRLFSEFPHRKSTILWTSMISGLNQNECHHEALQLYREMRSYDIMPDQATFASVLKACSTSTSLRDGTEIHSFVFRIGFNSDVLVASALIDMYAKCGDVKSALQVFKGIDSKWDVIAWNSIIVGLAKNGYVEDALKVFDEMMQLNVNPDDVTFLGALSACSHSGRVSEGRHIYDIMVNQYGIQPRNDHCACMIDLFARWGLLEEAESFIAKLGFEPDAMIWNSFLGACKLHGDDARGKHAAEKLIKLDPHNSSAYVSLSSLHASSGNWNEVDSLWRRMRENGVAKFPGSSWISTTTGDDHVHCLQ